MKGKGKSLFKFIIEFLSPTSSFVFTIIGAVLSTLLAIKFSGEAGAKLFALVLVIWLIFGITIFAIKYVEIEPLNTKMENLNKELEYKKITIDKQEKQLENQMYAIVGKYGEFGSFIKKNKSTELMRKLVNNFTYLESVQIHDWNIRVDDDNLTFKLTYDNGYVKEGININNINQQYYRVDKNIYKRFKRAIDYYKMYQDSLDEELTKRIVNDFTMILSDMPENYTPEYDRMIDIIMTILENILPSEVLDDIYNVNSSYIKSDVKPTDTDEDNNLENKSETSRCMQDNNINVRSESDNPPNGPETSQCEQSSNIDICSEDVEEESEDNITEYKRTGILGAILMNSDYMYEYDKKNDSKLYRRYFSFLDRLDNENKIITFVINSNSGEKITYQKLLKEVVSYYERLYDYLK